MATKNQPQDEDAARARRAPATDDLDFEEIDWESEGDELEAGALDVDELGANESERQSPDQGDAARRTHTRKP